MNDSLSPPVTTPKAAKVPTTSSHHGITRVDNYAWLRADNWQEVMRNPDVLPSDIKAYLEAENAYCKHIMADTSALQDTLFEEMKGRIKQDDSSVPSPDGPYAYYVSYVEGGQHPRFCRCLRAGGEEKVLLDGDSLAKNNSFFQLGGLAHSPDHRLLAYSTDVKGAEFYTIYFSDTETGTLLEETIEDTTGGITWAQDNKTVFYTRVDENHRPSKVFRHVIGTPASSDVLVYEERDPGFFVGVGKSLSGRYIMISAHDHETSEIHLIDAYKPDSEPEMVEARVAGIEYEIEDQENRFLILTNADLAEDFKIMTAGLENPAKSNWRELVPHKAGRLILSLGGFKDQFVRLERENGLPRIVISKTLDGDEHAIDFDEEAYSLGLSAGYEYDTSTLRFTYSSMTTPAQVFDYDVVSRERVLRKTQEVPSGHEPDDYITKRIYAQAQDGEEVPVTLLYRKSTALDGSAPLLLYGYGAYGHAMPAGFSTARLSLVDRGFIYAIAHVRGGKDKGFRWYKLGRREFKINTFTDFTAAGSHLITENYTSAGRIVAQGGSAGGLLVGAVANMAPQQYGAIIAEVPFVDALNTILDETLPLTPPEWPEWGNPITDEKAYAQIAAYSPYDNVSAQDYPPLLATGGLADPRVTYWEPAKWVARLRSLKTDNNVLLLKTNMDAGHAGASGRFEHLKEIAFSYAFALKMIDK
jgi:oligopeptidase B